MMREDGVRSVELARLVLESVRLFRAGSFSPAGHVLKQAATVAADIVAEADK